MRINKLTAIVLAGAISCTAPAMVYADDTSAAVDQAVEMLQESGVDELLSDPDKVVDIIVAAKEAVGQTDVSDDTISSAIDVAASSLDEEQLRSQINQVYDKLESLGITKEDVKGVFGKLVSLVKDILD